MREEDKVVCDRCWTGGWCKNPNACKCSCKNGCGPTGWMHSDRPCICGLGHKPGQCDGGR